MNCELTRDETLAALNRTRGRSTSTMRDRVEWVLKQKIDLARFAADDAALEALSVLAVADGLYARTTYLKDIQGSMRGVLEITQAVQRHKITLKKSQHPVYVVFVGCDIPAANASKARDRLRQILHKAAPELKPRVLAPFKQTGIVRCPVCLRKP